ncbi:MAG: FtsX-like permease family protein [Streptococcaceae bacterium]|jgi:putative ABC transport system permease protein|nr:FtsX-like permease family protein [Streptococcaceae bacterium]
MDFIRRAWLFTKAKLSRTILLIIAFSAILVFVLSGLIINSAANKSIANAEKQAGAVVSLGVNMQNVIKNAQSQTTSSSSTTTSSSSTTSTRPTFNIPKIAESTAQDIASKYASYISSYSMVLTNVSADAGTGITKVSETSTSSSSSSSSTRGFGGGNFGGASQGDFTVTGVSNLSAYSTFTGTYKLSSGSGITDSTVWNGVVIESELAKENNLKVGSTFTIKTTDGTKSETLTVVGIFTTQSSSTSDNSIAYMNTMYTTLKMANILNDTTGLISGAYYNMSNPANASSFVTKANKIVNNSSFTVSKDDTAYQTAKTTLGNVAGFAKNIVILVAIAGAIILALIVMLMIRERRYEIGVLMSLGEQKIKIVGQFFAELFIVMIVSVVIATAAGNVVGNLVGQQVLKQETTSAQTSSGFPSQNGGTTTRPSGTPTGGFGGAARAFGIGRSSAETQALKKLNIQMSPTQILALVGIAILIALIAVGLASIGILRLNPKEVLTN